MTAARFLLRFERSARAIRRALGLRRVGVGLGAGMLAGAWGGFLVWTLRDPVPRLWPFFSLTALGGLVGWLIARRRALTDEEVALFLDARLAANQLMVSALPLAKTAGSSAAARVVVERADEVLGSASRRSLRPRLATPWLSMVPAGALLMWLASALEPRPAQVGDAPAVDVDAVREEQVPELERLLEAVAKITPADAE